MDINTIERFAKRYIVDRETGCWMWTAGKDGGGYGNQWDGQRVRMAHAIAYEIYNGPVPYGCELDHKCRTHACVNPAHLEAVTHRVNVLRGVGLTAAHAKKTHCPSGHAYKGNNLYVWHGRRICRTCNLAASKARYRRIRGAK